MATQYATAGNGNWTVPGWTKPNYPAEDTVNTPGDVMYPGGTPGWTGVPEPNSPQQPQQFGAPQQYGQQAPQPYQYGQQPVGPSQVPVAAPMQYGQQAPQPYQYGQQPVAPSQAPAPVASSSGGSNPYLQSQANAITNQVNTNLTQNQLPSINRGSVANGGYGGSRQGIAQGLAMNGANQAISNSLAGMYGNAYQADQANATQQSIAAGNNATQSQIAQGQLGLGYTQAQNSYNLGLGNLGLGNKQADQNYTLGLGGLNNQATANNQNFYSTQRGQDLQQQNQGFNQYLSSLNAQLGMGQQQYNIGNQQQQQQWQPVQNLGNVLSPWSGLNGNTTTAGGASGGGFAGAAGGALTAAQIIAILNGQP